AFSSLLASLSHYSHYLPFTPSLFFSPLLSFCHLFFFYCYGHHRDLHSFPTRRSSDLASLQITLIFLPQNFSSLHPILSDSSPNRSEEHTSELQSRFDLVCRLLLEKKKKEK